MQWTDSVVSIIIPHALDTKRILHCPVARRQPMPYAYT